jgi:glycosyltransferase involved in cell wall biosynthesis
MTNISIVVPAHNESERLCETLENYVESFDHFSNGDYEIIVVCNGCEDNTPQLAEEFARRNNHIKVVKVTERIGKGGAIKVGLKSASGAVCLFADADGSTSPEECEKLISAVRDGCEVAIGSRKVKGSKILLRQPLSRCIAGWFFNKLVRMLFNLPFQDTQCGAKAFRRDAVNFILDTVKTNGFSFDVDLLWRLKQHGYRIREMPVVWKDSGGSTLALYKHAPSMLSEILRLRFSSKNGR